MLKVRLDHDSTNPEKRKLSQKIADDIARFLENGGQIQVLSIQARHHPDFDTGISEEFREAQRRRGAKASRSSRKRPKNDTFED